MILPRIDRSCRDEYINTEPFPHIIFDNFFEASWAQKLFYEIPALDNPIWHQYNNKIENKYACRQWLAFPETTYRTFSYFL